MKEGDIRAKVQKRAVAPPADNSRKSISKNYTPSPSVHDNEATIVAKECRQRSHEHRLLIGNRKPFQKCTYRISVTMGDIKMDKSFYFFSTITQKSQQ